MMNAGTGRGLQYALFLFTSSRCSLLTTRGASQAGRNKQRGNLSQYTYLQSSGGLMSRGRSMSSNQSHQAQISVNECRPSAPAPAAEQGQGADRLFLRLPLLAYAFGETPRFQKNLNLLIDERIHTRPGPISSPSAVRAPTSIRSFSKTRLCDRLL
ncbi:hypothetical protein IWX49DRAFT_560430, partial [Phyllosticta citricarpa]